MDRPSWWDWELEFSSHAIKRMLERGFSESDVRAMLEDATVVVEQSHGTFVVASFHLRRPCEIIVVPDRKEQRMVVVSVYLLS